MKKLLSKILLCATAGFGASIGVIPALTTLSTQMPSQQLTNEQIRAQDNIAYARYQHMDPIAAAYAVGAPGMAFSQMLDSIYATASQDGNLDASNAAFETSNVSQMFYKFFYQDTNHSDTPNTTLLSANSIDDTNTYTHAWDVMTDQAEVTWSQAMGVWNMHGAAELPNTTQGVSIVKADGTVANEIGVTYTGLIADAKRLFGDQLYQDSLGLAELGSLFADVFYTNINMNELNWFRNIFIPATYSTSFLQSIKAGEASQATGGQLDFRELVLPWAQGAVTNVKTLNNTYDDYINSLMYKLSHYLGIKYDVNPLNPSDPNPCSDNPTACIMDSIHPRSYTTNTHMRFDPYNLTAGGQNYLEKGIWGAVNNFHMVDRHPALVYHQDGWLAPDDNTLNPFSTDDGDSDHIQAFYELQGTVPDSITIEDEIWSPQYSMRVSSDIAILPRNLGLNKYQYDKPSWTSGAFNDSSSFATAMFYPDAGALAGDWCTSGEANPDPSYTGKVMNVHDFDWSHNQTQNDLTQYVYVTYTFQTQ